MLDVRSEAGECARQRTYLFFAPPKKSRQKKGGPTVRDPPLRSGQPAVLVPKAVRQNSRRSLRSLCSDSCRKLEHEAVASYSATARLWPCAPRHGQRGGHPLGPLLRSALHVLVASEWSYSFSRPRETGHKSEGRGAGHAGVAAELALPGRWLRPPGGWRIAPQGEPIPQAAGCVPLGGDGASAPQGGIINLLAEHQFAATPAVLLGLYAHHLLCEPISEPDLPFTGR